MAPWPLLFAQPLAALDVAVIGAGPAGISAAYHLMEQKVSVALLEKDERPGGRVQTLRIGPGAVDLGPAWIHYGTANPLSYLAEKGNCSMRRTENFNMEVHFDGRKVSPEVLHEMVNLLDEIDKDYEEWQEAFPEDASLLEVLREIFSRKSLSRAQEAAMTALLYGEVVEDWTAPLSELSAFYHCRYEAVDGVGSDWRLVQGMGCVVEAMGDVESVLQVKEEVRSVRELEEIVWLEPQQLNASVAVVAVPLGVLKTRGLAIEPLPAWKQRAWLELGLGNAVRAVLEFEEVFWHQKEFFMDVNWPSCGNQSFLDSVDLCSIEFTTGIGAAVLVAEVDGRLAQKLEPLPDEAIKAFFLERLERMFHQRLVLKSFHIARPWGLPFWHKRSKGRGSAMRAGKALRRVVFAGDYVSRHVGTVASAYLSGIQAAHATLCLLGRRGLALAEHPAIHRMVKPACASRLGGCAVSLWELLSKCSRLPNLRDESWRTCFVQGHDRWKAEDFKKSWWSSMWQRAKGLLKAEL